MRKAIHQLRRTVRDLFFAAAFLTALAIVYTLSQIPTQYYYASAAAAFIGLILWRIVKSKFATKYENKDGYIVLYKEKELEHRYIARKILGRNLKHNEVVHHINGRKTDNQIGNLCVMDRQRHDSFHSWLDEKKNKLGRYPHINYQKKALVRSYGGTLLDAPILEEHYPVTKRHRFTVDDYQRSHGRKTVKNERDVSQQLFEQLRRERKRLADTKGVPAYIIFHDYTLHEMVRRLPDTQELMSQVNGLGPEKLRMYGDLFISIIKNFKNAQRKDIA